MTGDVMFHEFIKKPEEKESEKRELPDDTENNKIEEKNIKKKRVRKEKSTT